MRRRHPQRIRNPRWLGGTGAFTLVLHTWTQELRRHIHVHALMACGAVQQAHDGAAQWLRPTRAAGFLFPVHALSRVFRGKFLTELQRAEQSTRLRADPAQSPEQRRRRLRALRSHDWVVYAKTPLAGPAAVLEYLSRYTHRTAVGNERIVAIEAEQVRLRVRGNADDRGRARGQRCIAIDGCDFVGRLLQHVLPGGFKRIRHYGLLAAPVKRRLLPLARSLLAMPPPNARAPEDAAAFMRRVAAIDIGRCGHCARGRWQVIAQCSAAHFALAAVATVRARAPP